MCGDAQYEDWFVPRARLKFATQEDAQEGNLPRIHFHQQLAELKDKLLAMAALSQQAVESAVDAWPAARRSLCQYVRENETAINTAQREVDEMAYELLSQRAAHGNRSAVHPGGDQD